MVARTRIPRISKKRLAANGGRYPASSISKRSPVRKNNKPIPKMNVEATKKRRARNAKRMRGVEYQSARAGAMKRAGERCEFIEVVRERVGPFARLFGMELRCPMKTTLQFHEECYPKTRPLTPDDGKIYCGFHHRLAESLKPHKQHRSGF